MNNLEIVNKLICDKIVCGNIRIINAELQFLIICGHLDLTFSHANSKKQTPTVGMQLK